MNLIKKISLVLLITLSVSSFLFVSCQNETVNSEQELSQLEIDAAKIDELLEAYKPILANKASKMEDDKVITFEVVKNLKTSEISIQNEKEVSFFPIDERSAYYNRGSASYQVDCSGCSGGDWSEGCDGKWSCGSLIAKCLDQGGCATICEQEISQRGNTQKLYSSVQVTYLAVK